MRAAVCLAALLAILATGAIAGGPAYIAGTSYFDSNVKGSAVVWPAGTINYYTDQGNLSLLLPGTAADSFVADAFAQWTSISTAALTANHAGHLAEDVNGSNVTVLNGHITLPNDILPSAAQTPVGIVYDYDGAVTDALLGTGASAPLYCAQNSVFGGIDNIATNATFVHALIVINGKCATGSAQLPDLKYHLVRVIGRVLGLDWSQANLNVITASPPPTAADYFGFPLMHENDLSACTPVATCYSNNNTVDPALPKFDDQAAISALYPVTPKNVATLGGKQVFAQTTARIHGSVYFDDEFGLGQPMQGVNVVARWVDPDTGSPSGAYVVTSISGFLFRGNAGNGVSGYNDTNGNRFDRYGSDDGSLEGFFDLSGLPLPGGSSATYELSVEAVDPLWSANAGPYGSTTQVTPSGSTMPIYVTVGPGSDVNEDLFMTGGAVQQQLWYSPTSYASPAKIPPSGSWSGVLSPYGSTDYFQFPAHANRSFSIKLLAVDELGQATQSKAMPVVGVWGIANPGQSPAPVYTPSAFNSLNFAETRLDVNVLQTTALRVGIADYRGDGRPDFAYAAHIFYGDQVMPARAGVLGGTPLAVSGLGLRRDTIVQIAGLSLPVIGASTSHILIQSPPAADGVYDVTLRDAASDVTSTMSGALIIGASPGDILKLISGAGSATPVGGQANAPFAVQVLAADGKTPVAGATVRISSSPASAFSACAGGWYCNVVTDQYGMVSSWVTVLVSGMITLTAKLAPVSYPGAPQVQATILGTESSLDLSLSTPSVWVAQGASLDVPLKARVLSNGVPLPGKTVNYQITQGSGTLSGGSAQTDSDGYARTTLQLQSVSAMVQVSVCMAPGNSPCQILRVYAVSESSLRLQPVSGNWQIASPGKGFQPVVIRVVDSATPAHNVMGATVAFVDYVGRMPGNQPIIWAGEASITQFVTPVILDSSQAKVASDATGLASFAISSGSFAGNVVVIGSASVGSSELAFGAQQFGP